MCSPKRTKHLSESPSSTYIGRTLGAQYRVFTARTGEDGLRVLADEDIALVISDQVMPGMSGV